MNQKDNTFTFKKVECEVLMSHLSENVQEKCRNKKIWVKRGLFYKDRYLKGFTFIYVIDVSGI